MVSAVTTSGLGSGIDVQSVVSQLLAADRAGSDLQFTRQTNTANTKLSALGSLKSALSGFQSSLSSLETLKSFDKKSATSSDSSSVGAIARFNAVPNSYNVEVSQVATAHSMASTSFADTTSAIGTGTMTFRFGTTSYNANTDVYSGFTLNPDSNVSTLTIDSSNNSLTGIMTAINNGNFGVSASIVRAGDGYKLLLASNKTGVKNSLEVTVNDGDSNNTDTGASAGLSNFAFNSAATNLVQTSAAVDANYKINGLALTSSDNVIKDAVAGVDLTLGKVTTAPIAVTISKDNSLALSAMQGFISGYNSLARTLASLTSYDATKKVGGPLLGDFTVRSVTAQAQNILHGAIGGITGDLNSLPSIGITTNADGTLVLDTARFTNLLNTSPGQLPAIFQAVGAPTDANISYQASTNDTVAGNYAVNVTSVATAGSYSGGGVLPAFTPGNYLTLDADNSTFTINVDGVSSGSLALTQGEYRSGAALAQEIQARINGASSLVNAGVAVAVSYDSNNNNLKILSNSLGSTSTVNMTAVGTNVAAALGLTVQIGTAGTNVAGSIAGAAAVGAGAVLSAASTTDARGLQLTVAGTATGARGTVNFTRGINNQLDLLFNNILATTGGLQNRIDDFNKQLQHITDAKANKELQWAAVKSRYMIQFTAMDTLVSNLNSTSSFLTTQLANLPGVGK
jgi:flagellar hook-associated protein 2